MLNILYNMQIGEMQHEIILNIYRGCGKNLEKMSNEEAIRSSLRCSAFDVHRRPIFSLFNRAKTGATRLPI